MEKHCILRFIDGFPLPAEFNLMAPSVRQAIEDLGPNVVLASLNIDEFRAHFIQVGEEKILVTLEDAMNCKRKAEQGGRDPLSKRKRTRTC